MAFIVPNSFSLPIDYALAFIFPLHSHIALNYVISDYVPKAIRGAARGGLLAATVVTIAGLLKLTYDGPGLTETIKALWKTKEVDTKAAKK